MMNPLFNSVISFHILEVCNISEKLGKLLIGKKYICEVKKRILHSQLNNCLFMLVMFFDKIQASST